MWVHVYWPPCSLLLRRKGWVNETEAHVFTLAEWAASELHGKGESTFSVEKAPLWLTGPARLWGSVSISSSGSDWLLLSGLAAPNKNKKQEYICHKIDYPLKVKGCMQQGRVWWVVCWLQAIPALMKGLECQGHPSRVVCVTVSFGNAHNFIPREENSSTNLCGALPPPCCRYVSAMCFPSPVSPSNCFQRENNNRRVGFSGFTEDHKFLNVGHKFLKQGGLSTKPRISIHFTVPSVFWEENGFLVLTFGRS